MTADAELVGRSEELTEIEAFLAGAPGALVIAGEAGIGKTSVWRAAVARAEARGTRVLAARPARAEAALSFAVLADLLEPILAEVGETLPEVQRLALDRVVGGTAGADADARLVAAATRAALRAAGPLVLAVDDVQWTDAASAAALGFALRRLGEAAVWVLLAHRSSEPMPFELDAATLALRPLSLGALQRLLVQRLAVRLPRSALARVHEVSGGNAFYAQELARAYTDVQGVVVPKPLHDLLAARLRVLPPETRRALALLALGAGDAGADVVAAFDAGILEPGPGGAAFAHPLLAEAAIALVPPAELRGLHAELARIAPSGELRARHRALAATEPDEEVAAELETAAEEAAARGAGAGAIELLELSLGATPDGAGPERVRRRLRRAELLVASNDHGLARPELERLAAELPPGSERAHVWQLLALGPKDTGTLIELMQRAYDETEDEVRAVEYGCRLAWSCHFLGVERGEEIAREALARAERLNDPRLRCAALGTLANCELAAGRDPTEAIELGFATGEDEGVVRDFNSPQHALAKLRMSQGRYDEARLLYVDVLRRAEERGDEYARQLIAGDRITLELKAGRWHDLLGLLEDKEVGRAHDDVGHFQASDLRYRATVHAYLGNAEQARAAAQACLAQLAAGTPAYTLQVVTVLAFLALSEGRPDEAAALLEPQLVEAVARGRRGGDVGVPNARGLVCEALLATGEVEHARLVLEDLERRVAPFEASAAAAARRCRALLAAGEGEPEAAIELLRAAGPPEPFERARNELLAGTLLRRARRRGEAREALQAAQAELARLGARLWVARAEEELSRLGGRTPAGGALTETERRVGELVASGLSNKEVAARLVVTVGTVEAHLSRIYAKLSIRSRTELAGRWPQNVGESPIVEEGAEI